MIGLRNWLRASVAVPAFFAGVVAVSAQVPAPAAPGQQPQAVKRCGDFPCGQQPAKPQAVKPQPAQQPQVRAPAPAGGGAAAQQQQLQQQRAQQAAQQQQQLQMQRQQAAQQAAQQKAQQAAQQKALQQQQLQQRQQAAQQAQQAQQQKLQQQQQLQQQRQQAAQQAQQQKLQQQQQLQLQRQQALEQQKAKQLELQQQRQQAAQQAQQQKLQQQQLLQQQRQQAGQAPQAPGAQQLAPGQRPTGRNAAGVLLCGDFPCKTVGGQPAQQPGVQGGGQQVIRQPGVPGGGQQVIQQPGIQGGGQQVIRQPGVQGGGQQVIQQPGVQGGGQQVIQQPGVQGGGQQVIRQPGVQGGGQQVIQQPGFQGGGQQVIQQPGFQGQPGFQQGGVPGQQPFRRESRGIGAAGAAAIGVGAGLVGGYLLSNQIRGGVNEVRTYRDSYSDGGVTYVREPGRVIVRDQGGAAFIRHNEVERFAVLGYQTREERDGAYMRTYYDRPDGVRIISVTDDDGRLLRRIRRYPNGREVIIIDNTFRPAPTRFVDQVVTLPPPVLTIPRERYIVDAGVSDETTIYEALSAPPLTKINRRYTLDEVRYSADLRAQMRSVDINTITFETGSWIVESSQVQRLSVIAAAINKAISVNAEEVFLIEGHTDAVGDRDDNLSLSDRRAQSVAEILTRDFAIPAENLTTQGYGETQLRIATDGAARANRRVTVRRITPLIGGGGTDGDASMSSSSSSSATTTRTVIETQQTVPAGQSQ